MIGKSTEAFPVLILVTGLENCVFTLFINKKLSFYFFEKCNKIAQKYLL
ncbi:hypothetical protein [Lysinibacillus sp. 3P01SB]